MLKVFAAAYVNQYFADVSGLPDFMIFSINMLRDGANAVRMAGSFNNQCEISKDDIVE